MTTKLLGIKSYVMYVLNRNCSKSNLNCITIKIYRTIHVLSCFCYTGAISVDRPVIMGSRSRLDGSRVDMETGTRVSVAGRRVTSDSQKIGPFGDKKLNFPMENRHKIRSILVFDSPPNTQHDLFTINVLGNCFSFHKISISLYNEIIGIIFIFSWTSLSRSRFGPRCKHAMHSVWMSMTA